MTALIADPQSAKTSGKSSAPVEPKSAFEAIPAWFWGLALITTLLPRLALLPAPPGRDQETSAVASMMLNQGAVPYQDFLLLRGPLFLLIHSASLKLFGNTISAINAPDLLCWAGLTVFTALAARALWGKRAGMIAAVLVAFASSLPTSIGYYIKGQPEQWVALGWMLLAWQLAELAKGKTKPFSHLLWAGMGLGFATAIKPSGLAGFAPVLFGLFVCAPRLRSNAFQFKSLAPLMLGFCTLVLPLTIYLVAKGALNAFYESLFVVGADYTQTMGASAVVGLARWLIWLPLVNGLGGWLLFGLAWGALLFDWKAKERRWLVLIPASFWLTALVINALQPLLNYRDLLVLPWLVLFAARGIDLLASTSSLRVSRRAQAAGWAVGCVVILCQTSAHVELYAQAAKLFMGKMTREEYYAFLNNRRWHYQFILTDDAAGQLKVGETIKARTRLGERIQVWDSTGLIYLSSERFPATIHLWHQFLIYEGKRSALNGRVGPQAKEQFVADLQAHPPAYFVMRSGDKATNPFQFEDSAVLARQTPGLMEFLNRRYILEETLKASVGEYQLYRLKEGN